MMRKMKKTKKMKKMRLLKRFLNLQQRLERTRKEEFNTEVEVPGSYGDEKHAKRVWAPSKRGLSFWISIDYGGLLQ
jgi:hypothetical protein